MQAHNITFATHLVTATGAFAYSHFNFLSGLAGAFLDATNQFIFFSFDELQIVVSELRQLLFHFALGNVPGSFDRKRAHIISALFPPCDLARRENLLQVACRPFERIIFP